MLTKISSSLVTGNLFFYQLKLKPINSKCIFLSNLVAVTVFYDFGPNSGFFLMSQMEKCH